MKMQIRFGWQTARICSFSTVWDGAPMEEGEHPFLAPLDTCKWEHFSTYRAGKNLLQHDIKFMN
jgi:hypothetical protein